MPLIPNETRTTQYFIIVIDWRIFYFWSPVIFHFLSMPDGQQQIDESM